MYEAEKRERGEIFPLFPSEDPTPILRKGFAPDLGRARNMQGGGRDAGTRRPPLKKSKGCRSVGMGSLCRQDEW